MLRLVVVFALAALVCSLINPANAYSAAYASASGNGNAQASANANANANANTVSRSRCIEGQEYDECPNKDCRPETCDQLGFPLDCDQYRYVDVNSTDFSCGEPRCRCQKGFVKNAEGKCIAATECPSCGGDSNRVSGCGNYIATCGNYKKEDKTLKGVDTSAYCDPNGCECREGYVFDVLANKCKTPEECATCPKDEVYVECPYKECRPESCDQVGFPLECEQFTEEDKEKPDFYCDFPRCYCKKGFVRNRDGKCVDATTCPSCGGDINKRAGCSSFCTTCSNYDQIRLVSCSSFCKPNGCDCLPGYVYNTNTTKCVQPENCFACKEDEEFVECPNLYSECRPETCDQLGFPLECDKYTLVSPDDPEFTCGKPRCMCKKGYVKDKSGKCVASTSCPSCGGDPNKQSGCGVYCTNCSNYNKESLFACSTYLCPPNGCECRPNYIYDPKTTNCTLPENCT